MPGSAVLKGAWLALLALPAWASAAAPTAPEHIDPALQARAQAAVADLAGSLRSQLQAALQQGGPVAAIDFCAERAPALAAEVAARHGLRIGRNGVRIRNPDNTPGDWQREALDEFALRFQQPDPALTPWLRAGASAGEPRLRYAQPIRTEAPCLACHGEQIAEPVAAALRKHYPQDRATGFREGSLRGQFWVEID